MPPSTPARARGVPAGWIIFGVLAVGVLGVGLLGWGAYRLVQRVDNEPRQPYERVDYLDSVPPALPSGAEDLPDYVDSVQREMAGEEGRVLPPDPDTYESSALDTPPQMLNRDEVAAALQRNYPPLLRDAGIGGRVMLRYRITRDGGVDAGSVEVVESTHDAFTEAAARVVKQMQFRPGRHNGSPVAVWVVQPIDFRPA
ncbi:MAG TPA: energy transducer TonB [Longimicrobium sp.]|nr:energy transducer TonB [Longimicrobium sp.]